jgi:cobalamin biosynthesis protein CobW
VSDAAPARVPALVVSGFLGAGKTSVVRHLLASAQRAGERVAVISNELGELGIDAALLGAGEHEYVELAGGCVCCKLADDFVEALERLHQRARPERVIVETSGAALPHDTQLNFWREPVVRWIGEDVVAVAVNAEQVAAGRDLEGLFEDQVSSADFLLLTQIDRAPRAALPGVRARLAELAPGAPVIDVLHGRVDPRVLFAPDVAAHRAQRVRDAHSHPHAHEDFRAEELAVEPGLAPARLREQLVALRALRVKGFAATSEGVRLVQGVGERIELEPADAPPAGLLNRLVVIRRVS